MYNTINVLSTQWYRRKSWHKRAQYVIGDIHGNAYLLFNVTIRLLKAFSWMALLHLDNGSTIYMFVEHISQLGKVLLSGNARGIMQIEKSPNYCDGGGNY